jgi:hypothetical protein
VKVFNLGVVRGYHGSAAKEVPQGPHVCQVAL